MQKELTYKYIIYFGGLILLLGFFMDIYSPFESEIFDIVYDFIWYTAVIVAFFIIKKNVLFIGLIFFTFEFNIGLLYYSILPFNNPYILSPDLKSLENVFLIIGLICYILGFWNIIESKYLNREPKIDNVMTLTIIILITVITQIFIRTL